MRASGKCTESNCTSTSQKYVLLWLRQKNHITHSVRRSRKSLCMMSATSSVCIFKKTGFVVEYKSCSSRTIHCVKFILHTRSCMTKNVYVRSNSRNIGSKIVVSLVIGFSPVLCVHSTIFEL